MTYYNMVGGGKDLSVPGVDLQCTCHFFNTGVLTVQYRHHLHLYCTKQVSIYTCIVH